LDTFQRLAFDKCLRKMTNITIPPGDLTFYRQQAVFKIKSEGWNGRNKEQKEHNFYNCWVTEDAFKRILTQHNVEFNNRAVYFGKPDAAGMDFTCWKNGKEVTIGIRSINKDSAYKWKSVAYPNDRFCDEPEKIADYIVACHHEDGNVTFFGCVGKEKFMELLGKSRILHSRMNQEKFRTVPLEEFSLLEMSGVLEGLDRV
jgi:hypothetical protein